MADPSSSTAPSRPPARLRGAGSLFVAAGILSSRLFGLVRERVFAHYLGNSMEAGAFRAALRIPNLLQNLFGEGALSASFIPVYVRRLADGARLEAERVAGAVFGLLAVATSVLVLAGVLWTPALIDLVAPGFEGATRDLAIRLVRILFPGTGLLVLSAWCLGILNSHRRFFLSYAAPVVWNLAIIGALVAFGRVGGDEAVLVERVAWGAVAGSALQFAIQLPTVFRLLGQFRPSLDIGFAPVRQVLRNFLPVLGGRGVVQISAYLDTAYASLVSARALSALAYAQTLYLIPVSLFGMAVSAAELPEMSRAQGTTEEVATRLRERLRAGLRRISFFVVPSSAVFVGLGDVVAGALLQTGRFEASDTRYLWYLLAGSSVGLVAATQGRLYASAFYALQDTRTPLVFATARVAFVAVAGWFAAVRLPELVGLPPEFGAVGITVSSGLAAWLEFVLLRARLSAQLGKVDLGAGLAARLWSAALLAVGTGLLVKWLLAATFGTVPGTTDVLGGSILPMPNLWPVWTAVAVLPVVGLVYGGLTWLLRIDEMRGLVAKLVGRLHR